MREKWRPVFEYESWYSVANLGRVRSEAKILPVERRGKSFHVPRKARILEPCLVRRYAHVKLCQRGSIKQRSVHRLVLEAFVGPCPDGMETNHRDGVKTNNRLENLEYVTRSQNQIHALALGLKVPMRGPRNGMYGRKSSGFTGRKHTEEARRKMSAAHGGNTYAQGSKRSLDHIARLRAGHFAWRERQGI